MQEFNNRRLATKFRTAGIRVAAGFLTALLVAPAQGQTTNWLSDANGEWSVAGNWDNGVPNGDEAVAAIGVTLTATRTITLTENVVVNAIHLTSPTSSPRLEVNPSSPHTFTFAGTNPVIHSTAHAGGDAALRIHAPVIMGTEGITKTGGGSAAFMNTITGSGTLTFSGGTTELRGNSTGFTGEIVINSGAILQARAFAGTGAHVLGDTEHGTVIHGNGQFLTRDSSNKIISEPFVLNGIRTNGSIRCYAGTNITLDGPITLNGDSSFSVADWKPSTNTVGNLRQFFVNSVIADSPATPRSVYFLTDLSSPSFRGTEGRKSEIIVGGQNTYGGATFVTTNYADDGSGTFSGTLRLGADNALPAGTTLTLGGSHSTTGGTLGTGAGSGRFALTGHNQELAGLLTSGTGALNRVVGNSATLSTLTLNIASDTTNSYNGYLGWSDTNDNNLALAKTGAGTLTLGADNTYAGGTTVSAGVLRTTASGALGSGAIVVANGAKLQLDAAGNYTVANAMTLSGNGGAGYDGAVTSKAADVDVTLTGPITLSGSADIKTRGTSTTHITIAGGVDGSSGNHNLYLFSDSSGRVVVRDNPINLGAGRLGGGFDLNVAGNVAGTLLAQWNQTVKLGVDNPFTAAPALELGNNSGANGYYGRLDLNGHTFTARSISEINTNTPGTSEVTDSAGGGTFILNNISGATSTFSGKITGNVNLTKQGDGTLVLSNAHTYVGTTTVTEGVLRVTNSDALGSTAVGTTVANFASVEVYGGITVAEPITITGGGYPAATSWYGALRSTGGNNMWSGPISVTGGARIGIRTNETFTLTGGITSNGSTSFAGSANGTIRITTTPINLSGNLLAIDTTTTLLEVAGNTWNNTTISYGGTLKLGVESAMPATTVVTIGSSNNTNGTLDLNAHSQTIAGLYDLGTGTRRVINSGAGSPTLTVNNISNYTYGGVLGITGQEGFGLTKRGSGTLTLSGANAYTGPTVVTGGILALGHASGNNISNSPLIRVGQGATLDVTGLAGGRLALAGGQALAGSGTIAGGVDVSGGAALSPGMSLGTLTLTGDLTLYEDADWIWEFVEARTAGADYDSVTGPKLLLPEAGGKVNLSIQALDGYSLSAGDSFTLFAGDVYAADGTTLFAHGTNLNEFFHITDNIGWWGSWEVTAGSLILTAVPEPSSLFLLASLVGVFLLGRRRTQPARCAA